MVWREGEVPPRDGEAWCREGERDGEREEGEREEEDGDGVPCWEGSGRAAARARMAEDRSLESHTVTSWRVCGEERREDERGWPQCWKYDDHMGLTWTGTE